MQRFCSLIAVLVIGALCASSSFAQGNQRDGRWSRDDHDRWSRDDHNRWSRDDHNRWSGDEHHGHDTHIVFGSKARVEQLAADLYRQANSICWEMHRYYQRNPGYTETYSDMYKIREAAKRIDDMARDSYHRRRHADDKFARDLTELDRLFHHIDADIRSWRPSRRDDSRGDDLESMMNRLEHMLHDALDDYGIKSAFRGREIGRGPTPPRSIYPPIR